MLLPLSLRLYNLNARISAETNLDKLLVPVTLCIFVDTMPHACAYIVALTRITNGLPFGLGMPLFRNVWNGAHDRCSPGLWFALWFAVRVHAWSYRKARASVSHAVLAAWPAMRRITKV